MRATVRGRVETEDDVATRLRRQSKVLADALGAFGHVEDDADRYIEALVRDVASLLDAMCTVHLLSSDGEIERSAVDASDPELAARMRAEFAVRPRRLAAEPILRAVIASRKPHNLSDVDAVSLAPNVSEATAQFHVKARLRQAMLVPLCVQGRCLGTIGVARHGDDAPRFDDDDAAFVDSLARLVALAASHAREHAGRERLTKRLRVLAEVSRALADTTGSEDDVYQRIASELASALGDQCAVLLTEPDGERVVASAVEGRDADVLALTRELLARRLRIDEHPILEAVRVTGRPVLVPRVDLEALRDRTAPDLYAYGKRIGTHSVLAVPLTFRTERLGFLIFSRYRPESPPFDDDDVNLAVSLAEQASLAAANVRARAAERRAQGRFERLATSGILGVAIITADGRVLETNDALHAILGWSREELVSGAVPWASVTPPEWQTQVEAARFDLLATGVARIQPKAFLHRDGHRVPVLVGAALLDGVDAGNVILFVLDARSDPRLHAAIQQLSEVRASETAFRSFLEAAPDAVLIVAADSKLVLVNSEAERLFGYPRGELIGETLEALIPERLRAGHAKVRDAYHARPEVRPMGPGRELRARRKDGTEIDVEISLGPVETPDGVVVAAVVRDVTDRRRADEARFRLAAIVEASDDAIIGKNLDGEVTSWNEGARRLFGWSASDMIGASIVRIIPDDRRSEEARILADVQRGESLGLETVRLHKDGTLIHVSLTCSPIRDASGRVVGAAKVARDITARRAAESQLRIAKDAAEATNRELEAFSYSVAHDLRAPLRGTSEFARLLLDEYGASLGDEARDYIGEIVSNARRMGERIDALLALARVTRQPLRPAVVDLSALVDSAVTKWRKVDPDRRVELVVETGIEAPLDPALARALVDNLIENAWKFTSKTAAARIQFGEAPRDHEGARVFFVRDNGAGFDMAYAAKLFAPFQRLHSFEAYPGTGIGLATVQRIVRRHGGSISAEGAVGAGATFSFSIPAAHPERQKPAEVSS